VPLVTHVHGAHAIEDSDGYAEAWFLAAANNIPAGYATVGTWYDTFKAEAQSRFGQRWDRGSAVFQYQNDQAATTLWYHDHALGMTRVNVYAGPAGFYNLRGGAFDAPAGVLPGPAPMPGDPPGRKYYEIPIAIQDRSFNADGSLFYPDSRDFFGDVPAGGPFVPTTDVPPIWNPEFFGNTMLVNGNTWPRLRVEPRRYRFRLLNGCDARFLKLALQTLGGAPVPMWQIGAEGGFLPAAVETIELLMSSAERADVIVDFSLYGGQTIRMLNFAPDEPYNGDPLQLPSDPATTGQVMQFEVVLPLASPDLSTPPQLLGALPAEPSNAKAVDLMRQVSLNEMTSVSFAPAFDAPIMAMLGLTAFDAVGNPVGIPLGWANRMTEKPKLGATETWEIYNFTGDAHPIHLHQVQFQVLNREPFGVPGAVARGPEARELGFKDTVTAYPGEITRVKATFDLPGLYVWHCHIIEHEDNEMMRRMRIGKKAGVVLEFGFGEGGGAAANDASGFGNNGTIANGTWVSDVSRDGQPGVFLRFNGTGTKVTVPDNNSLDVPEMTLEAWVKPANVSGYRNVILKQLSANPSEGLAYALYANSDGDGGPGTYIRPSGWGSDQRAVAAPRLAVGAWKHLAATYDAQTLRLYVNGALVASTNVTTPLRASGLPLFIGGNPLWGEFFSGLMADVRIYNRALTDAEIKEDMAELV